MEIMSNEEYRKVDAISSSDVIIEWERLYDGPTNWGEARSVAMISQSRYIVAGNSYSVNIEEGRNNGIVIILDQIGDIISQYSYGDPGNDGFNSVIVNSDNNYIVSGYFERASTDRYAWVLNLEATS